MSDGRELTVVGDRVSGWPGDIEPYFFQSYGTEGAMRTPINGKLPAAVPFQIAG